MVQRDVDPLTGARRDDILISADDLARLNLADGARVTLRSERGIFTGRLRRARIKPGNLEVHWPEGNALLAADRVDPDSMAPDCNAEVTVEPADQRSGRA
jgi:anaerobic selenocysteine-containing dehydrogenase